MSPFELRKVIVVGFKFDAPEGAPLLDRDGLPARMVEHPVVLRVAFWVPQKPPYQRRGIKMNPNPPSRTELDDPLEGYTLVRNCQPFELEALNAGAIAEEVIDFNYEKQPSLERMRIDFVPVWEKLTVEALGVLPNATPIDKDPKPLIELASV